MIDLKKHKFCLMPWTHLTHHADGYFAPCCKVDSRLKHKGKFAKDLKEAWESEDLETMRKAFRANFKLPECKLCWEEEKAGKVSDRMARIKHISAQFGEERVFELIKSKSLDAPKSLDLKFSNLCNLKCRICSPSYSSQVAREYTKFGFDPGLIADYQKEKWQEGTANIEQFKRWLPHIDHIEKNDGAQIIKWLEE